MMYFVLLLSLVFLLAIAYTVWRRLDLNIDFWRWRDPRQFCWVFDEVTGRPTNLLNGKYLDRVNDISLITYNTEMRKNNHLLVKNDALEKRPRYRGRYIYHVKDGNLVPRDYMLSGITTGQHTITRTEIESWLEANFGEQFANALTESTFGWREIVLIFATLGAAAGAIFAFQANTALKSQAAILNMQSQELQVIQKYVIPPAPSGLTTLPTIPPGVK